MSTLERVFHSVLFEVLAVTLSIIGCVVNGPGEAKQTQVGITGGGKDNHMLYINGLETEKITTNEMIDKIVDIVEKKASSLKSN